MVVSCSVGRVHRRRTARGAMPERNGATRNTGSAWRRNRSHHVIIRAEQNARTPEKPRFQAHLLPVFLVISTYFFRCTLSKTPYCTKAVAPICKESFCMLRLPLQKGATWNAETRYSPISRGCSNSGPVNGDQESSESQVPIIIKYDRFLICNRQWS